MRRARHAALVFASLLGCAAPGLPPSVDHPLAGEEAPAFRHADTEDGEVGIPIEEPGTRVVVLDFWASWCAGCLQSMPALDALWREKRGEGVLVVGVSVDENPRDARALVQSTGVSFPVVLDPEMAIARRYRVGKIPTTFVVDGRGTVRWVGRDPRKLRQAVDALLSERAHVARREE